MKFGLSDRPPIREDGTSVTPKSPVWILVFLLFILLLMAKVLWGYWERGITLGDTTNYFRNAVCWHESGTVNIVWSPLYTAYYGMWLNLSQNAVIATFLHRFGLIVITTTLVAWIGLLSLPRVLAMLLVSWWIVLPIHYDTLYEVHLFSTLPVLVLVIVSMSVSEKWRMPLIIGIALITTVLIRNEYVLALLVFVALLVFHILRNRRRCSWRLLFSSVFRYAVVMLFAGMLASFFYSKSYVTSSDTRDLLIANKHKLNMCQVYAFGYQQRDTSWTGSPWTDCSKLMEEKFGKPFPTLKEMVITNPGEVAKHFIWNLGLTKAGVEVLLFNATSSTDNPDYPPVTVRPVWPGLLFSLSLVILITGTILTYRNHQKEFEATRKDFSRMGPVLLAVALLSVAVITTQRPRPSYLLGTGIIYVWLVLTYVWRLTGRHVNWNNYKVFLSVAVPILIFVPSYRTLHGSKVSTLNQIYGELLPSQERIYDTPGPVAIDGSFSGIIEYLRPSIKKNYRPWTVKSTISFSSLPLDAFLNPDSLVTALEKLEVGTTIISPSLILRYPTLQDCATLRYAFLNHGWSRVSDPACNDKQCIAIYIKEYKKPESAG